MTKLAQRIKDAFSILTSKDDYAVIHQTPRRVYEWLEDQANMQGIPVGLKFIEVCAHECHSLERADIECADHFDIDDFIVEVDGNMELL